MRGYADGEGPRQPLRPLAQVLRARDEGQNPDLIERANRIRRHEALNDRLRNRAESRLLVLGVFFVAVFGLIGVRMGQLATSEPEEPRQAHFDSTITSARADILDRNGKVLATNLPTQALYAHPHEMVNIPNAINALARIFPDMDKDWMHSVLGREGAKFVWLRRTLSPEEVQAVHEIGEPGLLFASRDLRLYPNGRLAAHVLGGASYGEEGVNAAEVIGVAGIEKALDARLRDPELVGVPLELSIDLTLQSAVRTVLDGGMQIMGANSASAVIMDVTNGEILSMVSLPDFDPNRRPTPLLQGDPADSPLFNRSVQGLYELGSVFKIFTVAQALELGLVNPNTMIDTRGPMVQGRYKIDDYHNYGASLSVTDVIKHSSNIGTSRIALMIGGERQKAFLGSLGILEATPLEVVEAPGIKPLLQKSWGDIQTMTISFGHGLSTSQVHLAAAYATVFNGGYKVSPTLLKGDGGPRHGDRVVSEGTSKAMAKMMRTVVTDGTASFGEVEGYGVAGKTGTADKPKPTGGYYKNRNLVTFASVFPYDNPKYTVVVTLDEPSIYSYGEQRRTAGFTVVPVAAEIIRRVAPLLGMRPAIEGQAQLAVREARNTQ